jgi:hypothetical protein
VLRRLANAEETVTTMLEQRRIIENPTYGFFSDQVEVERMQERKKLQAQEA